VSGDIGRHTGRDPIFDVALDVVPKLGIDIALVTATMKGRS
jgi:hypothetical protein